MIQSIIMNILLFISTLFTSFGSSDAALSSQSVADRLAPATLIAAAPAGLATPSAEQADFITQEAWHSVDNADYLGMDFAEGTVHLACNNGALEVTDTAAGLSVHIGSLTESACPALHIEVAVEQFFSPSITIKVPAESGAHPSTIYAVNGGKAIALTR